MLVTYFAKKNLKKYQEDRSFYKQYKNGDSIFGVFDGHGGEWVSDYAAEHAPLFFTNMRKELKKDPQEALKVLFQKLVEKTKGFTCGSSASIVLVRNNIATIGVLGDSPVIIKTALRNIWKSPEHNVRTNEKECIAAIAKGGWISEVGYLFDRCQYQGMGLQMSRALGDKELNNVLNREPEIFQVPINNQSWILVCSDGLIDPSHNDANATTSIITAIDGTTIVAEQLVEDASILRKYDNSTAVLARV